MLDYLKKIVQEICCDKEIKYEELSKGLIVKLTKDDKISYIVGSKFEINSSTAVAIASDKYATYEVLKNSGVPVIEHNMIFNSKYRKRIYIRFK